MEDFLDASGAVAPLLLEAGDKRYVFTEILVIKRLIAEGRTETASRTARKFLEVAGESDSRYMEGYANYGIGLTCQAGGYLDESATAMEKATASCFPKRMPHQRPDFLLFRAGFSGNQPLRTLFSCSNSSTIDQKAENAATPAIVDQT